MSNVIVKKANVNSLTYARLQALAERYGFKTVPAFCNNFFTLWVSTPKSQRKGLLTR